MRTKHLFESLLLAILTLATSAVAAPTTAFTYQGRLFDGGNAANGFYDLQFTLYSAATGGASLAAPCVTNRVPVSDGVFTVTLDFGSVFNGGLCWLELAERTNGASSFGTLTPRQSLAAAPYATYAANAGISAALSGPLPAAQLPASVPLLDASGNLTLSGALSAKALTGDGSHLTGVTAAALSTSQAPAAGQMLSYDGASLAWTTPSAGSGTGAWLLGGNAGTTVPGDFLGTTDQQPLELWVNSRRALRLEPASSVTALNGFFPEYATNIAPNLVGGSDQNSVGNGAIGATIAGGGGIMVVADQFGPGPTTIIPNTIDSSWGTISGGWGNWIDMVSQNSTIGGGYGNYIPILSSNSTICGGSQNSLGTSTVGATIAGGENNTISGPSNDATISGGAFNAVATVATAGTIGGGLHNNISSVSPGATISGGTNNTTFGALAVVPGGDSNSALGANSLAAGHRAKASNRGAFVWADSSDVDFAPFNSGFGGGINSFNVRASGGMYVATAVDATSGAPTAGMYLQPGGSGWNVMSDQNAKTNFSDADPSDVLDRLAHVPIRAWNYKTQDASVTHLGPMAQDFNAAFGTGEADRSGEKRFINSIDADGVALAAIQGLNQKVEAQNAALRAENAALKARLDELERRLQSPK